MDSVEAVIDTQSPTLNKSELRDKQTDRRSEGQTNGHKDRWKDRGTYGRMDGRTEGRKERRSDVRYQRRPIDHQSVYIAVLDDQSKNDYYIARRSTLSLGVWTLSRGGLSRGTG